MHFCKLNIYFWLVVFILVLLASCQSKVEVENNFYFDTQDYIKAEVAVLKKTVQQITAKITLDDESETQTFNVDTASSFNDLENLFTQVNINKAIFKDEYIIDTFWLLDPVTQNNIEVLNYVTQNKDLKVAWMQVYNNGSLKAKISEKNFLFSYEKEIFYEKNKRFSTVSWQKTIGLDTLKVFNELEYQYK